jgi:DNA-binding NarL/FixJ family response regulator
MIDVCVVEDQTLVREGLETLLHLTSDIRVVSRASTGQEAIALLTSTQPDVVLLDVRMPEGSGLDVLRELAKLEVSIRAIILTTFDDDAVFLEACRLGAKGYLLKDVSLQALTGAIRTVAAGSTMFNPTVTERLLRVLQSTPASGKPIPEALTVRETEILRLMTGGYSNAEIAFALRVAEGTVKNHVSNILNKLDVRDRVRAVLRGIELGYLQKNSLPKSTP